MENSIITETKKIFNIIGLFSSLAFTLISDSVGKFLGKAVLWIQDCCGTTKKIDSVAKETLNSQFYIIGGGIAGLNTALLLLKEGVSGKNITILDENEECGGIYYRHVADHGKSFFAHTVRIFDEPSYRHTEEAWRQAGIWNSDHLIKRNHDQPRQTVPSEMRAAFLEIASKSDEELENMTIRDLFPPGMTETPIFRYFFHLTGLFDHHSGIALKRYITHTHGHMPDNWLLKSVSCDYESIIEPIVSHLQVEGVQIEHRRAVRKLSVDENHRIVAIDSTPLGPNAKVIVTIGANVSKGLVPEGALIYDDKATSPINPDVPLSTSVIQPHSSVWLRADDELASQIESRFPGLSEQDFIHIDTTHPWQITLISLGSAYYKEQPKGSRLFYIAMNDLSKSGLHIQRKGTDCSEAELSEEVLRRLGIWDIVQSSPTNYTATVDSRARQLGSRDSAPIVRFMPGEEKNLLVFPDTQCENLAIIGERVRAYQAPVPTTEWVTETGYRAIQYLLHGERYRMTKKEFESQESLHTARFVWNSMKYKLGITRSNFPSSVMVGPSKKPS
jgi:myosin-crossreactive antigen